MISSNKKCKSCSQILNTNKNELGYVPSLDNNPIYCQRCFQFKYYNKNSDPILSLQLVENKLNELKINNEYVFLICDILFLKTSLINLDKYAIKKLFIVINKIDCLPKSFNFDTTVSNILNTINSYNYKNYEVLYTSVNNNNSIKRLNKLLLSLEQNKKKIFIGKSNVGKSSLINALLKLNHTDQTLTTSCYLNTTLDFKKIKIKNTYIIDTPGFIDKQNILNFIDNVYIKKIINTNVNKINYFLPVNNTIAIEQLVTFDILEATKQTNVSFYLSKQLKLKRMKITNSLAYLNNDNIKLISYKQKNIVSYIFNIDDTKKINIIINGLCLISINPGIKKIRININKNVDLELCEYAII